MAQPVGRREAPVLCFGGFTLDLLRRGLYREGERVHLTAKPLETLIYLVEQRGRTVEKQDLLDAIWKDTAVTEDTLVQAVREIRRALRDDKVDPRFIQTVPRQGYRFVGEVTTATGPSASIDSPATVEVIESVLALGRRASPWRVAALVGLAGIGLLSIWFVLRDLSSDRPAAATALEQLTSEGVNAGKPAFSSEGNILYNSGGALHIRLAHSDTSLRITDRILPSGDMPVFTADGADVVFSVPRNGEDGSRLYDLYKVGSIGGPPQLFIAQASGAGFSPNGKWVAYTKHFPDRSALWISPVDHLDRHIEVRAGGYVPRWSPNGGWIAYTTADPNATSGELWIASVSPSKNDGLLVSDHTRLTGEPQSMYGLSWTRDGGSIIFAARRPGWPMHLYLVRTSGGGVTALTSGPGDYACPSVSPDGKRVIFWHGTPVKNLMVADGLASSPERPITDDEYHLWPALSPSGTHIASIVRRPTYEEHLYLTEIATKRRVALSTRPARHPSWIDEQTVAYLENTGSGRTDVRMVNIAAGLSPIRLTEFPGRAAWVAVHPNKRAVAAVLENADGTQRIVLREIGGGGSDRTLAEGAGYEHLRWLADGSALSWSGPERSSDPKSNGIWLVEPGRSAAHRIVADGYGPIWAADGKVVYFSRIREYAGLWKYDLRDAREIELRGWAEGRYEFDIVGDRLVFTEEGGRGRIYAMSLDR